MAMQRCMLDILAEVQAEVHRERQIVWPEPDADPTATADRTRLGEGTAGDGGGGGPSAIVSARAVPQEGSIHSGSSSIQLGLQPVGLALRLDREEAQRRERRQLVESLSARGTCGSAPSTARRRLPRSQGRQPESPGLGPTAMHHSAGGPPRQPTKPRVVHRHHHQHYHHHYVLNASDEAELPPTLCESMVESSTGAPAHAMRSSQVGGGAPDANALAAERGHPAGDRNVEHLHYHHHVKEDQILPRARRLLAHAQKALQSSNAEQEQSQGAGMAGFSGPSTRLPRLS